MKKLIGILVVAGGVATVAFTACSNTQPQSSCFLQAGDIGAPFYVKYTIENETGNCSFLGQHTDANGKHVAGDAIGVTLFGTGTQQSIGLQPLSVATGKPLASGSLTALGALNTDPSSCSAPTLSPISASITDPNANFPAAYPRLLGFDGGCAILDDGGIGFADGGLGCIIGSSGSSGSSSGSDSGSTGSGSGSTGSTGSASGSTGSGSGSTGSGSGSSGSTGSGSGSTGSTAATGSSSGSTGSTGAADAGLPDAGLPDAGGADAGLPASATPMVQVTYTFKNVKIVQAGNVPGTEFTADLDYNQTPLTAGATACQATLHVDGVWYNASSLGAWPDGGTPPDIITTTADGGVVDHGFIGNHCDVDSDCTSSLFGLPGGGTDFECVPLIQPFDTTVPCETDLETAAACADAAATGNQSECVCGSPGRCIPAEDGGLEGFCGETMWDGGIGNPNRCVPKTMPAGATDCETNCGAD